MLLGLAVASSPVSPRWLGWTAMIAGAGSVAVRLVQGRWGDQRGDQNPSIILPTVITLWLAWMGVLLLRIKRAEDDEPIPGPAE